MFEHDPQAEFCLCDFCCYQALCNSAEDEEELSESETLQAVREDENKK